MERFLRAIQWKTPWGKWNKEEIKIDLYIMGLAFIIIAFITGMYIFLERTI